MHENNKLLTKGFSKAQISFRNDTCTNLNKRKLKDFYFITELFAVEITEKTKPLQMSFKREIDVNVYNHGIQY